jgi:hypothetical protein
MLEHAAWESKSGLNLGLQSANFGHCARVTVKKAVLPNPLLHYVIIELCPPYPTMAWHQFECVRSKDDTNHLALP